MSKIKRAKLEHNNIGGSRKCQGMKEQRGDQSFRLGQDRSGQVWSGRVMFGQFRKGQVSTDPLKSYNDLTILNQIFEIILFLFLLLLFSTLLVTLSRFCMCHHRDNFLFAGKSISWQTALKRLITVQDIFCHKNCKLHIKVQLALSFILRCDFFDGLFVLFELNDAF